MGFPALSDGWHPTRDSLHLYSRVLGAVRAAVADPHPLWWHIALRVEGAGLGTGELRLPDGGETFALTLDLEGHQLLLAAGGGERTLVDLRSAPTGRALGEEALAALAELGSELDLERRRWDDDAERSYDPDHASAYHGALAATARLFERFRLSLPGKRSPVQLWPHHFDLSFERFFGRTVERGEGEKKKESRAQIGIGLSPGDDDFAAPYYYANPWPFDAKLLDLELPGRGRWLSEPWEGALLPYAEVVAGGPALLERFLATVDRAAAPGLTS